MPFPFTLHFNLAGRHAFLSASKYHWIRYDDEKLLQVFDNHLEAQRGTELHDLARDLIRHGIKLERKPKTLNMYVNDCIGHKMTPEQPLFFTENGFGTADAIKFDKGKLWIFDLKNGLTPAKVDQLMIYAAYFCLEYDIRPQDIEIELRIYQNDEVRIYEPDPEDIRNVMETARRFDAIIEKRKAQVLR